MKRMKSWWKDPNQTPAQVIAKRKVISKLIKEIDISEPDDEGIPLFGNELKQEMSNVRTRVSSYSKVEKKSLLKRARKTVKSKK